MNAEMKARQLLDLAGITVNGTKPYDIQVHNPDLYGRVLAHGSVGFGEAYMDGSWDSEQPDELICRLVAADLEAEVSPSPEFLGLLLKSKLTNMQSVRGAKKVAEIHYDHTDLNLVTYQRVGSCAYWKDATTLEEAQKAKLDLVCRKLDLQKNELLLDIGCGWGALLAHAVENYGVRGVGITISVGQARYAREQYGHLPIRFEVMDYRHFNERVDKIASVGMFEHVGPKNYRAYFRMARKCLKSPEEGRFLLHTIWNKKRYSCVNPWIDKYIFPGGVLPTPGQLLSATEGLFDVVEEVENFGIYYDRTLMAWWDNFKAHRDEMARKYGERFCRGWEFYLFSCAGAFRSRSINVGQFLLSPRGIPGGYARV